MSRADQSARFGQWGRKVFAIQQETKNGAPDKGAPFKGATAG
jgi:hypothetical protein